MRVIASSVLNKVSTVFTGPYARVIFGTRFMGVKMSVHRIIATTALFVGTLVGGTVMDAQQAFAAGRAPAELPPSSYVGTQYVDSSGCVFVRAGSGNTVSWIPRMSRDRQHMCNAQPTVVGGANNTGRTTAASTASRVVQLTVPSAAQTQTRVTPPRVTFRPEGTATTPSQNQNNNVASAAPAPSTQPSAVTVAPSTGTTRTVTVSTPRRPAVLPVVTPRVAATPTTTTRPVTTTAAANTCALSGISTQYVTSRRGLAVRCGPQQVHPSAYVSRTTGTRATTTAAQAASQPTAQSGGAPFEVTNPNAQVAAGYRSVWNDGRLNPNRGPRGGAAATAGRVVMWTSVAPYRLIDIATGEDVTALYPQYTPPSQTVAVATSRYNFPPQTSAAGRYIPSYSSRTPTSAEATVTRSRTQAAQVTSARTGTAPITVGRGHRYVQLGAYANPANVNRAIATLHRLGLPAAKIRTTQSGRAIELVVSGPFNDAQSLARALQSARASGYGDAITRK